MTQQFHSQVLYIPKRMEDMSTQNLYIKFMVALFLLAKKYKQPKCLSTDECRNEIATSI